MSIPKEPRQLMINLMYLVLTALLALNVSAEVMNAFFTLDKSISASNGIVDSGNDKVLKSMATIVDEKTNYKPLHEAAMKANEVVKEFNRYVDGIRDKLLTAAGGAFPDDFKDPIKRGRPKRYQDKEIPTRLFVDGQDAMGKKEEPVGPEFKAKINETRQKLMDIYVEASKQNIDGTNFTEAELNALKDKFALNVDEEAAKAAGKSWEDFTFGHMPVAACYPILRKYQSDATTSGAAVINALASEIGETIIEFDKFEPVAAAEKGYVIKGEPFKAEIFLSAFSSQAAEGISYRVNGASLPIKEGKGQFTTTPTTIGEKEFKVDISVKNPFTGKVDTYSKSFKYEVGERSVAVSADKMNVFYIGVDNPVSVSAAGISSNDLKVSINGGGGSISKTGSSNYMVKVSTPTDDCRINVVGGGLSDSKLFRVKRIPDPTARLGNKEDGVMGNGEFKAQGGLIAWLDNFDFDAKCDIQGFTLVRVPKREDAIESVNPGGRYNDKSSRLVEAAKPGDSYYFRDVKARCPGDSAGRKINSLVFTIK